MVETIKFTMDFITFLAVCTTIVGVGGFTLAIIRYRNSAQSSWNNRVPSKTFSVIDAKIKEFYDGSCASQRGHFEMLIKNQERLQGVELKALKDVLHGELIQINTILDSKINQVNETLGDGLRRIEERIEAANSAGRRKKE